MTKYNRDVYPCTTKCTSKCKSASINMQVTINIHRKFGAFNILYYAYLKCLLSTHKCILQYLYPLMPRSKSKLRRLTFITILKCRTLFSGFFLLTIRLIITAFKGVFNFSPDVVVIIYFYKSGKPCNNDAEENYKNLLSRTIWRLVALLFSSHVAPTREQL